MTFIHLCSQGKHFLTLIKNLNYPDDNDNYSKLTIPTLYAFTRDVDFAGQHLKTLLGCY